MGQAKRGTGTRIMRYRVCKTELLHIHLGGHGLRFLTNSWKFYNNRHYCVCLSHNSVEFSSVTQLCLTLCDPMNHSTPGLPVHHQLPEFTDSRPSSQWCHPAISSSVIPFFSCPQSLTASESFPMRTLRMRWPKYGSFSFSILRVHKYSIHTYIWL